MVLQPLHHTYRGIKKKKKFHTWITSHVPVYGSKEQGGETMCALNLDSFSFDEHKNDVWVVVLYCQLSFALVNLAVL